MHMHVGVVDPFPSAPGQLDPTNPNAMALLRDVYADVVAAFEQPPVFHLGGNTLPAHAFGP